MSTSDDRTAEDLQSVTGATGPGPDSADAGSTTAATAGSGQAVPDTGPGPAAADVDGPDDRDGR